MSSHYPNVGVYTRLEVCCISALFPITPTMFVCCIYNAIHIYVSSQLRIKMFLNSIPIHASMYVHWRSSFRQLKECMACFQSLNVYISFFSKTSCRQCSVVLWTSLHLLEIAHLPTVCTQPLALDLRNRLTHQLVVQCSQLRLYNWKFDTNDFAPTASKARLDCDDQCIYVLFDPWPLNIFWSSCARRRRRWWKLEFISARASPSFSAGTQLVYYGTGPLQCLCDVPQRLMF